MQARFGMLAAMTMACTSACAHAPRRAAPDPTPSSEPISVSPTGDPPELPKGAQCVAVHDGQCFESADAACAAAGCADRRCEVLQSSPARVSCIDER